MKSEIVFRRRHELAQIGVTVRGLTEITKDTAANCKRAAEFCEIRHIEGLTGFLGIAHSFRGSCSVIFVPTIRFIKN